MTSHVEGSEILTFNSYCRICFTTKSSMKEITAIIKKEFENITKMELLKLDSMPYQICMVCEKRFRKSRDYRQTLIKNETWFLKQIQEHPAKSPSPLNEEIIFVPLKGEPIIQSTNEIIENEIISEINEISDDCLVAEELDEDSWLIEVEENCLAAQPLKNDVPKPRPAMNNVPKPRPTQNNVFRPVINDYSKLQPVDLPKKSQTNDVPKSRSRRKDCLIPRTFIEDNHLQSSKNVTPRIVHDLPESNRVNCPKCSRSMPKSFLKYHIKREHASPDGYHCDICGEKFRTRILISAHMRKHLSGKKSSPAKSYNKCVCEICAWELKDAYNLEIHMKVKHQGFRYNCPRDGCNKYFETSGGLYVHIQNTHDAGSYICETCGQILVSERLLNRHVSLYHSENKFFCSFCKKGYPKRWLKNAHEKKHTETYVCQYCSQTFTAHSHLTSHIQVRHEIRKYNCRVEGCGSVLRTKDNYKGHLKTIHRSMPNLEKFLREATEMKPDFYRSVEECEFDK